jgi:hypothetical protein
MSEIVSFIAGSEITPARGVTLAILAGVTLRRLAGWLTDALCALRRGA